MSSPLSAARVLGVDGLTARIRIAPQQALTLPYSDFFALALAYEPFVDIVYSQPGTPWRRPIAGPLRDAVDADLGGAGAASDAFSGGGDRDRLLAVARRYVKHAGYRDPQGVLVPAGVAPDAAGFYTPRTPPTPKPVAHALVRAFDDYWVHRSGRAPEITAVLVATDARWLAHLAPGMLWDSYVFDDEAEMFP